MCVNSAEVNSAKEAYHVMLYGQHNLKFAATGLNSLSHRSHCIWTIKLLQHVQSEHPKSVQRTTFSFCDLAAAESAKKTHNVGEQLKESQNINTSLLVLGRYLMTIGDNQMNKSENLVPFKDSKLTRPFQRELPVKESLPMIVKVNPSPVFCEKTLNIFNIFSYSKTDNLYASQT
jgi:kinesin family protein 20